jgi:ribonuclease-3
VSSAAQGAALDWKTSLQELTATLGLGVPEYRVDEEGPDHAKVFHAVALVAGLRRGSGSGRSKKEAEQLAASAAFEAVEAEQGHTDLGETDLGEADRPPAVRA